MILTYRPIDTWPGELTTDRQRSVFKGDWRATLQLLTREVDFIGPNGARFHNDAVLQLDIKEGDIRQDGQLKAGRKIGHPGVILTCTGPDGQPLRFSCDHFDAGWGKERTEAWRQNVRAIALGLEALRKVERYGLGTGTEQYAGFQALGSGRPMGGVETMTVDEAARVLIAEADVPDNLGIRDVIANTANLREELYRRAAKRLHPDVGGDAEAFKRITQARELLAGT